MPIVGRALLIAVGRALGAVHIEDDDLRLLAFMNPVDPDPREVGTGQVLTSEIDKRLARLINLLNGEDEDKLPPEAVKE